MVNTNWFVTVDGITFITESSCIEIDHWNGATFDASALMIFNICGQLARILMAGGEDSIIIDIMIGICGSPETIAWKARIKVI